MLHRARSPVEKLTLRHIAAGPHAGACNGRGRLCCRRSCQELADGAPNQVMGACTAIVVHACMHAAAQPAILNDALLGVLPRFHAAPPALGCCRIPHHLGHRSFKAGPIHLGDQLDVNVRCASPRACFYTCCTCRHPQFPLWFSVACLLGGCVIFAGALHVHTDLYTYNIARQAEERRKNPSEAQRRISAMLMERRAQTLGDGRGGAKGEGLVGAAGGPRAYSDRPR